jgi:hypothetical protein
MSAHALFLINRANRQPTKYYASLRICLPQVRRKNCRSFDDQGARDKESPVSEMSKQRGGKDYRTLLCQDLQKKLTIAGNAADHAVAVRDCVRWSEY